MAGFVFTPRQRALFCVYAAVLIDMLGSALTLPTMPFFAADLGCAPFQLGNIFATFSFAQVLSQAWMGWAGDKVGRRPVLIVALLGPSMGFAASALAWDFPSLIAARAFLGLVSGCMATANAYVADVVQPSERARLMAGLDAMTSMAFLFGPPIGSALAQFGATIPFWVGCGTSFTAAVLAYFNLLAPERLDELEATDPVGSSRNLLRRMSSFKGQNRRSHGGKMAGDKMQPLLSRGPWAEEKKEKAAAAKAAAAKAAGKAVAPPKEAEWHMIGLIACASGLVTISGSTMMTCTALFLEARFGWGELELGFVMMAQGAIGVGVQLVVFPRCMSAFGVLGTAVFASSCLALGQFSLALLVHVPPGLSRILAFVAAQALFALSYILSGSVVSPALADRAGSDNLGRIVSLGAMVRSVGRIIGPLLLGSAFELSPELPYAIAGSLAAGGALLWLVTFFVGRTHHPAENARTLEKRARKAKRDQAVEALQTELRNLLTTRGVDLEDDLSIDCLFQALDRAFPMHRIESLIYYKDKEMPSLDEEESDELTQPDPQRQATDGI